MCWFCSGGSPVEAESSYFHASDAGPVTYAAASKPSLDLNGAIYQLRTQWGGSWEGTTESWGGTGAITYNFPTVPLAGGTENTGFTAMTSFQKTQARLAFELWDDLIARDITETATTTSNQIQFGYSSTTGNATYASSSYTGSTMNAYGTTNYSVVRSELWFATQWSSHNTDGAMGYGGYGLITYIHEIGHALGLSHPGTYNGSGYYATDAEYLQDTRRYTVMSYFNANEDGSGTDHWGLTGQWRYASTPMLHDIAAIQAIYGADMTTRTGNTVYGFNSTADRAIFDFALNPDPIIAIWDAGGVDTLDASGYTTNQRIDLTAGSYSDIGAMTNNVAIVYGATIENAYGGSGHDTIIGNMVANLLAGSLGNDTLRGLDGNDVLIGGAGTDVLDGGYGWDTASIQVLIGTTVQRTESGSYRISGFDGTDLLTGVEVLSGMDGSRALDRALQFNDMGGDGRADLVWQTSGGAVVSWAMAGSAATASTILASMPAGWSIEGTADFTGDGRADVVLRGAAGEVGLWEMTGPTISAARIVGTAPLSWQIHGLGDFNGDGVADLLWRHDDGTVGFWMMGPSGPISYAATSEASRAWELQGVGDFDGNGTSDVLLRENDGSVAVWLMEGGAIDARIEVAQPGFDWQVLSTGDFDGNGTDDILLRDADGRVGAWLMDGGQIAGAGIIAAAPASWQIQGVGDFDGNGRADIWWEHESGTNGVWSMNGLTLASAAAVTPVGSDWLLMA